MASRRKTTLYLDAVETSKLKEASMQEGVAQGAIVSKALKLYFRAHSARALSVGSGRSGRHDLSEKAEARLTGMGRRR
jgi:hypothetical protein